MTRTFSNLSDLQAFYVLLPEGATSDITAADLEIGNFTQAHIALPNGTEQDIIYTGVDRNSLTAINTTYAMVREIEQKESERRNQAPYSKSHSKMRMKRLYLPWSLRESSTFAGKTG